VLQRDLEEATDGTAQEGSGGLLDALATDESAQGLPGDRREDPVEAKAVRTELGARASARQRARRAAPGANTSGFTTLSGRCPSSTRAISSPQRRGTAATAAVEK